MEGPRPKQSKRRTWHKVKFDLLIRTEQVNYIGPPLLSLHNKEIIENLSCFKYISKVIRNKSMLHTREVVTEVLENN